MTANERRVQIMQILYRRGHETISALADEFGVDRRTVSRDIEALSLGNPIFTRTGRYGGGVYILPSDSSEYASRRAEELSVLNKIISDTERHSMCKLSDEELAVIRRMMKTIV